MCVRVCVCRLAPGRAAVAQDCEEAAGKCLCHWCHPGKADTQSSSHGHILGPGRSPNTLATTIPLLALSSSHSASSLSLTDALCLFLSGIYNSLALSASFNKHTLSRVFFFFFFNFTPDSSAKKEILRYTDEEGKIQFEDSQNF